MPRVSGLEKDSLPTSLQPLYDRFTETYGDFSNQLAVMAHAPDAFAHLYGLIDAWRGATTLPQRLVEIAVVTASRVNACAYCVAHHGLALVSHGLAAETVDGILEPRPPGLDAREVLVRDYARLVTERAWGIPDQLFERLREHFSEAQIVELTVRIGLCGLFNKFNQALQVDMERTVMADLQAVGLRAEDGKRRAPAVLHGDGRKRRR